MKDRIPGAPGRYSANLPAGEFQKMQNGKAFAITLTRDDDPIVAGTPYSKATVLPDDLAEKLCPGKANPTPADAFSALERNKAPNGYGLGGGSTAKAVTSITGNGWYVTKEDTPDGAWYICHSFVTNNGTDMTIEAWHLDGIKKYKRTKRNGVWGEWQKIWSEADGNIIASGTSGSWTYRKWSNGIAECWGKQSLNCGLSSGSVTFHFPFPFTEQPVVTMSAESMAINSFVGTMRCYAASSESEGMYDRYEGLIGIFQLSGDENATVSSVDDGAVFNVRCIGKWK